MAKVDAELRQALEQESNAAILIGRDYRILAINHAYRQRYGQPAGSGHRCHEVSHGYPTPCDENGELCPLKASLRSGRTERVLHVHHSPRGPEHCDIELRPIRDDAGRTHMFIEVITPVDMASAKSEGTGMIGRSAAFNRVVGLLRRVAPTDVPVLLLGESGTGKELAAQGLHRSSARQDGPFVPLECSGLSAGLFESELFGHEKGAFTGASAQKEGLVEAARGGTLFLDEIGDVPLDLQVKLLRLLESMTYRRVGGNDSHRADFRLVCATHRDLGAMVESGEFRQDLYYRISAFPVRMPALRERPSDIGLLADTFLERLEPRRRLSPAARALLQSYGFPGNIRELKNILQRAVLLADDDEIRLRDLPPQVGSGTASPTRGAAAELVTLDEAERRYLQWVVDTFRGSRKEMADAMGVSERTLYRKLDQLD